MAVKATALIESVLNNANDPSISPGQYMILAAYCGHDVSNPVSDACRCGPFPAATLQAAIHSSSAATIKADMIAKFGYSFTLLDTVNLLGWDVIGL